MKYIIAIKATDKEGERTELFEFPLKGQRDEFIEEAKLLSKKFGLTVDYITSEIETTDIN